MKKTFGQMKIEIIVKDAMTDGNDFKLNFYGKNAPVACIRAMIDNYGITVGEIYLPLETAEHPFQEPVKAPSNTSASVKGE